LPTCQKTKFNPTIPVKWKAAYGWAKGKLPQSEVSHFPVGLPENAKIFFRRGYMQGGTDFQILVPFDGNNWEPSEGEIFSTFVVEGRSSLPDEMPSPYLFVGTKEVNKMPEGTELYILKSRPYRQQTGFDWNHGTTTGVAQNIKEGWTLFWYSSW
jgi:hypothetical protein